MELDYKKVKEMNSNIKIFELPKILEKQAISPKVEQPKDFKSLP